MKDANIWVYDIEVFRNFHSCFLINRDTNEEKFFYIYEDTTKEVIEEYVMFLSSLKGMIGFNNVHYDYPVLHYLLNDCKLIYGNPILLLQKLYERSSEIVNRGENPLPPIAPWLVQIPQLDLFKIHHFDNKNKRTSLKNIEFVLRMKNIKDMPIHYTAYVKKEDIESIRIYNKNDVDSTMMLYNASLEDINLRRDINKLTGRNFINANDTKIGADILLFDIASRKDIDYKELKNQRTYRSIIDLDNCILPYIKFDCIEFSYILKQFKETTITTTKSPFEYSTIYQNVKFDFGVGGIHASTTPGRYISNEDRIIVDIDVSSFYPALAVINKFFPEHLGKEFYEAYKEKYLERLKRKVLIKEKKKKGIDSYEDKIFVAVWKLALNGTYGKSGDINSPFYDPMFTMQITVNGQLLICMLIELLFKRVQNLKLLQANTDGVTVIIDKKDYNFLIEICKEWENLTHLELEFANYREMIISDVNNYLAIYNKPEIELEPQFPKSFFYDNKYCIHKTKGRFQVVLEQNGKIAFNKNWSFRIIPMAIHDYFVHGTKIEDTIYNHKNIYDFCGRYKSIDEWYAKYTDKYGEQFPGKICRYYVSTRGGKLLKCNTSDGREQQVEADRLVTLFDDYIEKPMKEYFIDYEFYIIKCYKEINKIENKKMKQKFYKEVNETVKEKTQLKLF
jgi:hypothetical protein